MEPTVVHAREKADGIQRGIIMARTVEKTENTLWQELGEQSPHLALTAEFDPQSEWARISSARAAAVVLGSAVGTWNPCLSAISFLRNASSQRNSRFRPLRPARRKRHFHRKLRRNAIADGRLARRMRETVQHQFQSLPPDRKEDTRSSRSRRALAAARAAVPPSRPGTDPAWEEAAIPSVVFTRCRRTTGDVPTGG
jgi:hypothetical protein